MVGCDPLKQSLLHPHNADGWIAIDCSCDDEVRRAIGQFGKILERASTGELVVGTLLQ